MPFLRESTILFLCLMAAAEIVVAEDQIMIDPEKGLVVIEKEAGKGKKKPLVTFDESGKEWIQRKKVQRRNNLPPEMPVFTKSDSADLHIGRQKDSPSLYFMSGLEYFKNRDFRLALRNFQYADSVRPLPVFRLWMGKAYRQLGETEKMLEIMQGIVDRSPESDVADDALFEIAAHHQANDEFERATRLYTQLAEQYPFGETYSTGERTMEIANTQRRLMRAELNNLLASLGHVAEDLQGSIRNFQHAHRLVETGLADRRTVEAIRAAYRQMVEREQKRSAAIRQADRYLLLSAVAGACGFLIVCASLALIVRARTWQRQLAEIKNNLLEFDVRSL